MTAVPVNARLSSKADTEGNRIRHRLRSCSVCGWLENPRRRCNKTPRVTTRGPSRRRTWRIIRACVPGMSSGIVDLAGEEDQLAAAVVLRLLVTWLAGCGPAVQAFLADASNLPLLTDVVTSRWTALEASIIERGFRVIRING